MKRIATESKPYTVPSDTPTAEALIRCYWWDISRNPLLLANLRRPDGTLYLSKGERGMVAYSAVYNQSFDRENERSA